MNNLPNHYKRTGRRRYLTECWRLSRKLNQKFRVQSGNNSARQTWLDFYAGNNGYDKMKSDLVRHNSNVRKSWRLPRYNKRENVIEVYANYKGKGLKFLQVKKDTSLKERVLFSSCDRQMNSQEEDFVKIFGDSELPTNQLDKFFPEETLSTFCDLIDTLCG